MPSWQTDGNPDADIDANSFVGTRANDPLRIRTRTNVNNADVMTITPAPDATVTGRVGIGTPTPETKLHVRTGRLRISESDGAQGSGVLELSNGPRTNYVFTDGPTGHLYVRTDSATHHVLLQTGGTQGNVGIGTANPERWRLTIQGGELISFKNATGAMKWHINDWNGSALGSGDLNIAETGVADGRLYLKAGGNVGIGTTEPGARLHVMGDVQVSGDIRLEGADCAEDFNVSEAEEIEPGTVMVIDEGGALRQSQTAYDKMVVGVISNAGNYRPGIILDKRESRADRMPVALIGKVSCKVDAQYSPIEVGDLLTTSPTPGHAMKVDDPSKAFGSVIGKALHPLKGGQEIISVLVALQ